MKMQTLVLVLFGLFCGTGAASVSAAEDHVRGHSFEDAERWAAAWENEERDGWQMPVEVLGLLAIQPGQVVADLGAGTGYFTRPLSIAVGPGRVYAVDVEPSMLDWIRGREDVHHNRVVTVLAEPDDPKLPDGEIDLLLTVNTWHHIDKRGAYLKKLDRALAPDGRVVVIDFREGELPVGPPPSEKLSRAKVVKEFEKAGWTLAAESVMLPYQYMLTFYPPRNAGELELFPNAPSE